MAGNRRKALSYLHQEGDGYWRYIREVPKDLRQFLRIKRWRYSLGKEALEAERKAIKLRTEHDAMIASLRDPRTAEVSRLYIVQQRATERMNELIAKGAPDGVEQQEPDHVAKHRQAMATMWKRSPEILEETEEAPPEMALRRLALLSVVGFGDQSRFSMEHPPEFTPPTSKTEMRQLAAYKEMLDEQVEELSPKPTSPCAKALPFEVLEKYHTNNERDKNTIANQRKRLKRFIDFAGNRPLDEYTTQDFRDYITHLLPSVERGVVSQYFAILRTLWKWAAPEYDYYSQLKFPPINLPESKLTIEDRRWQAFTDEQIIKVWRLLNQAWSEDSKRKISQSRRKAFLMAVRVMLYTGMRPVEVWSLKHENIEGDMLHIKATKTDVPRKIPLSRHIADLPKFLEEGGFQGELNASIGTIYGGKIRSQPTDPASMAGTMRDEFRDIIRSGGITHEKLVLYSLKDTLVRKLQELDVADDTIRGIIGHVKAKGALRNYKTPSEKSENLIKKMRLALDSITYW